MMKAVLPVLLLSSAAFLSVHGAVTLEETAAQQQASFSGPSYAYNPVQSNNVTMGPGGSSSPRMLAQWPTLAGQGIAQTAFTMNGCAVRPPHVHQRATGLLYVIQASNLSVGFVSEGGQLIQNYVTSGASTIFPQGLVHFQQNLDCQPAYYTISYNSEDPGTQVIGPAYETLPASVAASSLGLSTSGYQGLENDLPKTAYVPNSDPDCVARCQAANINYLAPAPALSGFTSSAGR